MTTTTDRTKGTEYLDTKQAAQVLGMSEYTLRRWRHDGEGRGPRYFKINNRAVRYRQDDLDSFATKEPRE